MPGICWLSIASIQQQIMHLPTVAHDGARDLAFLIHLEQGSIGT